MVSWAQKQDKGKLSARENHSPPPRSRVTLHVTVIKGAVRKPEKPNGPVCRCYLYHKATGALFPLCAGAGSACLPFSSLDLVSSCCHVSTFSFALSDDLEGVSGLRGLGWGLGLLLAGLQLRAARPPASSICGRSSSREALHWDLTTACPRATFLLPRVV